MARVNKIDRVLNAWEADLKRDLKVIEGLRARLDMLPKRARSRKGAVLAASLNKQVDAA